MAPSGKNKLGGAFSLKKYDKFSRKIAQSGFYIILFLCISAIGISGYVFFLAQDTKTEVAESMETPMPLELPSALMEIPEVSEEKEESQPTPEEEKKPEVKEEKVATPPKEEKVVYTMAVSGSVVAPFSDTELVKSKTMGDWRIHSGVDIKGEEGKDVKAIADGTVLSVMHDNMMGNVIKLEHKDGLISIYANLSDDIPKKVGESVKAGDVIGKIGNSALAECLEESHLHLEVLRDGKPIDPLSLFPAGED